ncbi:hypothetical protein [Methylobacterium sp. C1]|uniref:hypothetical protein n=1 Tax=Methylobacterium sp. C1 TaxID=1479019 RepID=UPI0013319E01|nr:hypothetical protein [Methylobacterium sp. C1]
MSEKDAIDVLAEQMKDLSIRVEVLHATLGTAISFLDARQRDMIIAVISRRQPLSPESDPRGIAARSLHDLIGYLAMERISSKPSTPAARNDD